VDTAFDVGQMKVGRKLAMKLLNVSKFVLAGEHADGLVTEPLDRGMLANVSNLVAEATVELDQYEYAKALAKIESFFWDFCDNYVEAAKSRRYGDFGPEAAASASVAMRTALSVVLRLLAPYLAFTCEEVWSWWQAGSIHRAPWPTERDVEEVSGADHDAQKANTFLSFALAGIRRAKTDSKVSVGTPVLEVEYRSTEEEIRCLRLVERDLKAAARTDALILTPSSDPNAFGASVTLKPAEA
jgi:valyl-tRNA synthetase